MLSFVAKELRAAGIFFGLRNQRVRFYGAGLEFYRVRVPHVQQPLIRCFRFTAAQILNFYFGHLVFLFNWLIASNIFPPFFHTLVIHPSLFLQLLHLRVACHTFNFLQTRPAHRYILRGRCCYCFHHTHWKAFCPRLLSMGIFEHQIFLTYRDRAGVYHQVPYRLGLALRAGWCMELVNHATAVEDHIRGNWAAAWCFVQGIHLALHQFP